MNILKLVLCLLLLTVNADAGMVVGGGVTAAVSCNASTDYIGYQVPASQTGGTAAENRMYLWRFQVSQSSGCSSGHIARYYLRHSDTGNDNAKVFIYTSGDTTPQNTDSLVATSDVINSADADTYAYVDEAGSVSLSTSTWYWIGFVSDATGWTYRQLTTGASSTMYYATVAGSYSSLPSTLNGISFSSLTRDIGVYATVGP